MVLLCYECTLESNKGCRLSWRLCLKQCLAHSDLICLESVVITMEFVCYVRDWTGVTGKSWSGFGPYMCKDGAKGSWTMGKSWADGAFNWWYKLICNPWWTQMLYCQPTMLHREQMKFSLRIRTVSMQVHTNHSACQQLIHSWCNVYLPGSNSSHSWQNFGQPSRRWWCFSITINLHWKKDKHGV